MTINPVHEIDSDLPFWPFWLCLECGIEYTQNTPKTIISWYEGQCDICKKIKTVTQLRYFIKGIKNE